MEQDSSNTELNSNYKISPKSFITKFLYVSAIFFVVNVIVSYIFPGLSSYGFVGILANINPLRIIASLAYGLFGLYIAFISSSIVISLIVGLLINASIAYYLCTKDPSSFEIIEDSNLASLKIILLGAFFFLDI